MYRMKCLLGESVWMIVEGFLPYYLVYVDNMWLNIMTSGTNFNYDFGVVQRVCTLSKCRVIILYYLSDNKSSLNIHALTNMVIMLKFYNVVAFLCNL